LVSSVDALAAAWRAWAAPEAPLGIGVIQVLGSAKPADPTVRVMPPVEHQEENRGAGDGHKRDDGKKDRVHRIAPMAPLVP
jgi:hypothetical protein